MRKDKLRAESRKKRHWRVRSQISGTPERPRLNVFRSNKFLYVQLIDDTKGHTMAAAATIQKDLKTQLGGKTDTIDAAKLLGKTIATRAKEKGIAKVCFDRGGYRYHGRIKAIADAAREAGLEF